MTVGIGRATLPAEFYDVTSDQLLIQPEPQYPHGRLLMEAMHVELQQMVAAGLPIQGRDVPFGGAPYISLEEMQRQLEDRSPYVDAVKADMTFMRSAQGRYQPGHVVRMNRPVFANTTYTLASREVSAGTVISTTPVNVSSQQVELTIKRYAGPLDPATGRPAPLAIERFDASRSVHSLKEVREMHFKRDFHRWLDAVGVALFDMVDTSNVVRPVGMATDDTSIVVGDFQMSLDVLRRMALRLDVTDIPQFSNGMKMAFITPLQALQLWDDLEFRQLAQFAPPKNPLLTGSYYYTVGNIEIFRSNTLTVSNNTNSIPIHRAQMFGPGMVGAAPGEMPRVVPNVQDNYGENPIAVWLFYAAFAVLDSRFGVSGRTS